MVCGTIATIGFERLRAPVGFSVTILDFLVSISSMKIKRVSRLIAVVLLIGIVLCFSVARSTNETLVFHVSVSPPFLDEPLAIRFASEAIHHVKPNTEWWPKRYSSSHAPDGSADSFLLRNEIDPNRGLVHFESAASRQEAIVTIELRGTNILCRVSKPK